MSRLKKFELHWEATIRGVQVVEAFDEEDAEEQFDRIKNADDIPEEPIYADLEEVVEVVVKKARGK